jgi:putative ABC transport system permease protein
MSIDLRLETLTHDIRYAMRGLSKSPGFLCVVVISLALGIAGNSTIFSVLNAILFSPMPYDHQERLVVIWETPLGHPEAPQPPPIAEMLDWQKQNHVFDDIALTSNTDLSAMSGAGEPEPIHVQNATPNFFALLGVKPVLGRVFFAEESQDRSQSVVLSDAFWQRKFNRDPNVLGKHFKIEASDSTVVGVMPPKFAPFYGEAIDLWLPINAASVRYTARLDHWLMPVARLKAGVTLQQAQVEMDVIARQIEQAYPATNKGVGKKVVFLRKELYNWAPGILYPLLGAVAFVLLIGCVNVANLMQSRAEGRRKEYALRASLGAGQRRLIQLLLAESGLLALLGGVLGILLTFLGIRLFLLLAGDDFPNADSIRVDARVLVFTLGVSMLTALLVGLLPAIQASRPDLNLALREGERRTATSRGWIRHVLAISEIGLAMVLLVGAGLMINTLVRLQRVNPGFESQNLLTMNLHLPEGGKYLERVPGGDMERPLPTSTAFYRQLLEKVSAIPGVESAGFGSRVRGAGGFYSFAIMSHTPPPPDQRPQAGYDEVSPGFFSTLKIPLKRGRYIDEHDTETAPFAVVINESFARKFFPNEDPIGQQLRLRFDPYPVDEERTRQIVGVVGDVKHFGLGRESPPFMYTSYQQQQAVFPGGAVIAHLSQNLLLRMAPGSMGREGDLASAVKRAVAEIDPERTVTDVMSMDELMRTTTELSRFYMRLLEIFAALALLLAVVGIYGVMSYFVSERTHEIGIRFALGAQAVDVLAMVAKLGIKLTLWGVLIGAGLALGLTRLIATFLYGVKPSDPLTYVAVGTALTAVALLACYIPARRATKVDPMVSLRYE